MSMSLDSQMVVLVVLPEPAAILLSKSGCVFVGYSIPGDIPLPIEVKIVDN